MTPVQRVWPHPHLTSSSKGEGPAGVFGRISYQEPTRSSPFQGEVGWGCCAPGDEEQTA